MVDVQQSMEVEGREAEGVVKLQRVDAVEKVGSKSRMRNNRIEEACCSTQRCAKYWFLESKLPCGTLKIFFQQHRP
jgi:hypothetical protein